MLLRMRQKGRETLSWRSCNRTRVIREQNEERRRVNKAPSCCAEGWIFILQEFILNKLPTDIIPTRFIL